MIILLWPISFSIFCLLFLLSSLFLSLMIESNWFPIACKYDSSKLSSLLFRIKVTCDLQFYILMVIHFSHEYYWCRNTMRYTWKKTHAKCRLAVFLIPWGCQWSFTRRMIYRNYAYTCNIFLKFAALCASTSISFVAFVNLWTLQK